MLSNHKVKTFIPTVNQARAKLFYNEKLGLKLISEDHFALEFDANGTPLRITTVGNFNPHPFTVLGWDVEDILPVIKSLQKAGITFEKYDFIDAATMPVWTAPGGTKVAWFKDPDGNVLSLSEHLT